MCVRNRWPVCSGTAHSGHALSRERIGLLRAAVMRSSENSKVWKGLPADEDFLEAFSVAMVSSQIPLPSGDVVTISDEQRLLFQTAAAAVLAADGGDSQNPDAQAVAANGTQHEASGGGRTPTAMHMHSSVFSSSWMELQGLFNSGRWAEMQSLLGQLFGEAGSAATPRHRGTPRSRTHSGNSYSSV